MNKFIKNLIFVLNIFSIICNAQFVPVVDAVKEEYAKIPDVTQILKNEIDKAKMALDNVKILLSNFNNFKLNLSFDDAGYLS
ncbi:hypothetical protein L6269_04490 [Candidatus Dependentiae bacterium]|nr:hypothetical protein [Candidatus Dependentiae bacterium]